MTGNNPKLDLVNVDLHTNMLRFCVFVLKILSGNEIVGTLYLLELPHRGGSNLYPQYYSSKNHCTLH